MVKLNPTWLVDLHEDEEAARQLIANSTDHIKGLAEEINGLSWSEIYQLPTVKALAD